MNIIKTAIEGVVIIEPNIFRDSRGSFFESFSQKEFEKKVCKTTFIQDNESQSSYGVLRGLHFQKPPFAQSKLVRVIKGKAWDDSEIGVDWKLIVDEILLSEKDKHHLSLSEIENPFTINDTLYR